jgi:putative cardiolipin synthase
MGAIIESADLANELASVMERDMSPENSWRVELDPEGELRWVSGDQVLTDQPARNFWQRVQDWLFLLFPQDLY